MAPLNAQLAYISAASSQHHAALELLQVHFCAMILLPEKNTQWHLNIRLGLNRKTHSILCPHKTLTKEACVKCLQALYKNSFPFQGHLHQQHLGMEGIGNLPPHMHLGNTSWS